MRQSRNFNSIGNVCRKGLSSDRKCLFCSRDLRRDEIFQKQSFNRVQSLNLIYHLFPLRPFSTYAEMTPLKKPLIQNLNLIKYIDATSLFHGMCCALPTVIHCPVIEVFLARSRYVCAQSSNSVYFTNFSYFLFLYITYI